MIELAKVVADLLGHAGVEFRDAQVGDIAFDFILDDFGRARSARE